MQTLKIIIGFLVISFSSSGIAAKISKPVHCPMTSQFSSSEVCNDKRVCQYNATIEGIKWYGYGYSLKNQNSNKVRIYSEGQFSLQCSYKNDSGNLIIGVLQTTFEENNMTCDAVDPAMNCKIGDSNCKFNCHFGN